MTDNLRRDGGRALRQELLSDLLSDTGNAVGGILNGAGNAVNSVVGGVNNVVQPIVAPVVSNVVQPIVAPIVAPVAPIVAPVVAPIVAPIAPILTPATPAPQPAPQPAAPSPPTTRPPAPAPAPANPATAPPSVPQTDAPASTSAPATESPSATDAPAATPTPKEKAVVPDVSAGSLDVGGKTHAFSAPIDDGSTPQTTQGDSTNFVNTKSDISGKHALSSSGSLSSSSRDKDSSGPSSVRTITGVGVSFGIAATLVLVVAVIMYIRRQRDRVQDQYKSDHFDPAELDSHRSDLDTASSSYMTGNLTSKGGVQLVSGSAWDDEELLVVRVPLESVVKSELISSGAFGEVYRGMIQDQEVAIKTLLPSKRKDMAEIKAFQAEIKLMSTLEHPRIVRFIGVAWESLSDLCVVTEFMAGGDLTSWLASMEASGRPHGFDVDKVKIALHVAHALMYLHSLQPAVIHRDLKSKNVLLDAEWNAKLADFGVSRERADETMTSGVGSSLWMAPEVTLGERYDEKADIYSFGVLLSELDTQLRPFAHARLEGSSDMIPATTVLQLVSLGVMSIKLTESPFFEDLQQLARQCVALDPKERPTAGEALHRIHLAYTDALDDQAVTL